MQECSSSAHVAFVLTKHGSHCGHMKGLWPWKQSWLDALVMQFFEAILTPGDAIITDPVVSEPLSPTPSTNSLADAGGPQPSRARLNRGHGSDSQLSSRQNSLAASPEDAAKLHCSFLPQARRSRPKDGKDKQQ